MGVFAQLGRRVDGRVFVVDAWLSRSVATVSHQDGRTERITLLPAERASIHLVPAATASTVLADAGRTGA